MTGKQLRTFQGDDWPINILAVRMLLLLLGHGRIEDLVLFCFLTKAKHHIFLSRECVRMGSKVSVLKKSKIVWTQVTLLTLLPWFLLRNG